MHANHQAQAPVHRVDDAKKAGMEAAKESGDALDRPMPAAGETNDVVNISGGMRTGQPMTAGNMTVPVAEPSLDDESMRTRTP